MQEISLLAERLLASQGGLCSMELVPCDISKQTTSVNDMDLSSIVVFRVVTPCSLIGSYESVRGTYRLYLQGWS
jgi:hypothetical protein